MTGFNETSLEGYSAELASGKRSPADLLKWSRDRIDKVEPGLHALNRDTLDAAKKNISNWQHDPDKPLAGIPYLLKDNICTEGIETNCSSKILEGFIPPYNATADSRVSDEGLQSIGKTNLDEFSMGSSTEYSAWGPTFNPYDLSRVPGGSSGGSAASVAAGYVPLALGSDTGGSVRQPAAFCGVVGLRPTYGRVSRWGLVAFASSLDQIGPITTTVRDSAIALSMIEGQDNLDSTLADKPKEDYLEKIEEDIDGLRVAVLDASFADWVDPRVKAVFDENVDWFKSKAGKVEEISLKSFELILAAYYTLAPSEASSNLARYDGIRYGPSVGIAPSGEDAAEDTSGNLLDFYCKNRSRGFGDEVTRRIMIGTFALSSGYYDAYYLRAKKVCSLVQSELAGLWKNFDILISPTAPTPPFKVGAYTGDPIDMYRSDLFVLLQPMAGCPAISVNGGWTEVNDDGKTSLKKSRCRNCFGKATTRLPIGIQISAPPFAEAALFRAARAFEREHN